MTKPSRTEDNARFAVKYTDDDFIEAIHECLKDATVSGAEIADMLGCNPRYATNRLKELTDKGKIVGVEKGRAWGFRLKK